MSKAVLEDLRTSGFALRLYWPEPEDPDQPTRPMPRLIVEGDEPLPPPLHEAVTENRDALKVALLLLNPPSWLARLFDLYWSEHDSPVRLKNPASGKVEVYMVHVSLKNICAAVAAEIGAPVLEWERLLPEVEEAIGSWMCSTEGLA